VPHGPVVIETPDHQVYRFETETDAQSFEQKVKEAGGSTTRLAAAEPPAPPVARTLYDLEMHLAALLDTEEAVSAEMEQQYEIELRETLTQVVEKRDRVGQFRLHLVSQIAVAKSERQRLTERQELYERALDRLDGYITRIIETLGTDPKGKRKKLEGRTLTLGLHGCDKSLNVTDEAAIPAKYKRVTVTLPAETWELMVDSLDLDVRAQVLDAVKSPRAEVDKTRAKADLKAGTEIPGAELAGGTYVEVK
jgi:hypothetical protein